MNKQKTRQHSHGKAKRNIQNQRTYDNIQKRRKLHEKNHPNTVIVSNHFGTRPTAKG